MTELHELNSFRDEVHVTTVPARTESLFLAGLRGAQQQATGAALPRPGETARRPGGRTRRPGRWQVIAATGAGLAVAAGAVTVAVLPSGPASHGRPGTPLTVQLLADRASAAALSQPAVRASQWVYREVDVRNPPGRPYRLQQWSTADNTQFVGTVPPSPRPGIPGVRSYPPGTIIRQQPIPLPVSYRALSSLPASPRALIQVLGNTPRGVSVNFRPGHAFGLLGDLLEYYVMPPRLTAEVYHALGVIPGVTINRHATDLAGQAGVGFLLPEHDLASEVIVNPRTYQFIGYEFLGPGGTVHAPGTWGAAIVRQMLVSGPRVSTRSR